MSHEIIAQREDAISDEPNIIEHALSYGHPKQQCVSPEQAQKIDEVISNPPPPTNALQRAIKRAHRFKFIP